MENLKPSAEELFEQAYTYPDTDMKERYSMLIGLDEQKNKLKKILGLLVNPTGIEEWAKKHHPSAKKIIHTVLRRPPLIVLAGDVGAGKTELALTIGDEVARQEKINITLLPISLSARGNGRVGQMTQLISTAFEYTIEKAKKIKGQSGAARGAVILLVDEADALAQSRENTQMHHEDKAGVNAFIRGIDNLGNGKLPAAVLMCTNRIGSLDPAIKRRSAEVLYFNRPSKDQRLNVLNGPLQELGFNLKDVEEIVEMTGESKEFEYGFTFSDLTQRLIPSIILDAYPDKNVTPTRAKEIAKGIIPTSPFKEY
ncbi:MAG: AAA family ATPase [Bacteroidetes bacterium]|uniref:AAA family ATPase n=1 Tax=Phnomibacter sp. TaxID=2836217 RepID=UPI002FDEBDB3|nr:AAA family ATPase [Bacteroidota bacterium]